MEENKVNRIPLTDLDEEEKKEPRQPEPWEILHLSQSKEG